LYLYFFRFGFKTDEGKMSLETQASRNPKNLVTQALAVPVVPEVLKILTLNKIVRQQRTEMKVVLPKKVVLMVL
jgi:hypothetical protein